VHITNKEEVIAALQNARDTIRAYGVCQYGLFGSFARNEQRDTSDMNLGFFLEELLGRRVDLLTKEALSPYIGPRILREVEYVSLTA
jgi:uncharacterized protein